MASEQINVSATLDQLGPRIKQLRVENDLTLEEVAQRSGQSISTLSRLENGQRKPTLELLLPLCEIFGVSMDELISPAPPVDPRISFPPRTTRDGKTIWPLTPHSSAVQAWKIQLPFATRRPQLITHHGREWFYTLQGTVRLILAEQDLLITEGQAVEFDTKIPHWFGAASPEKTLVLSIFSREGERMHLHETEK